MKKHISITVISALALLISACSGTHFGEFKSLKSKKEAQHYAQQRVAYYKKNPKQLQKDFKQLSTLYSRLEKNVDSVWGKSQRQIPSKKKYVKYTNGYQDRAYIDFEKNIVRVETISKNNSLRHLKQAIVTTLLAPSNPNAVDIFSDKPIPTEKTIPFLYQQVLDQDNKAVRWRWRANRYADYLISQHLEKSVKNNKRIYAVQFALVKESENIRSYQYASFVRQASKRYQIDESLIYAIIKTESSFNPYAVSHASAYGLMQVIPSTAGKDVFNLVKKRQGQPTKAYLFDPQQNIDTGTAYLYILKTRYLKGVANSVARHYAAISAYNGGAGNVFNTFNRDRTKAVQVMNTKNSQQIYDILTTQHRSEESRNYLYKVNKYEKLFINERK